MPTYQVAIIKDSLNQSKKDALAQIITNAHHQVTNSPKFLVQVIFNEQDVSNFYIGGQQSPGNIFINGIIKSGRSSKQRYDISRIIMKDVAQLTGLDECFVWVYLTNITHDDILEFGKPLFDPGHDKEWIETLPPQIKEWIDTL